MSDQGPWRNRIVDTADVAPDTLAAHPQNWRIHAPDQRRQMTDVLDGIGWVQGVLVNRSTGTILDGHMRVGLALERGETTVPVNYVDVTPDEETVILGTLDPIKTLAGTDPAQLRGLREGLLSRNPTLAALAGWTAREQDRAEMTLDHTAAFVEDEGGTDVFGGQDDENPYTALAIRQLQFVMDEAMYDRALDVFDRVIAAEGLETNADAVLWLIDRYGSDQA